MSEPPPRAIRTSSDRVVVGGLLLCGAALVLVGPGLLRWLGTAMMLGGLWELRYLVPKLPERVVGWVPLAVLAAAFVALFWQLLLGRPPATRDHGIHYFQTRLLWDELIPSGRLWGWSETLGAGYPYGESYPVLGYLLGGLPHALSFGLVGPRASYAWGIAITWALGTLACGWLAHAIARAVRPDAARWAFCAGGLLWLFDAGASRQGGWNYLMFHGVWPQMFSAVLWALSLTLTLRALERPSPRRISAAGLLLGASVMAHPFGMLAAAASAGLLLAVVLLSSRGMPAPLRTWLLIHCVAAGASVAVVLVFFGSSEGMARSPVQWSPLGQLSYEVLTEGLFSTHWAWLGPCCVLGLIGVARRPNPAGLLAVLLAAALVVLGSHEAMTVLRLDLLVSGFKNLQFPRYSIELKPVLFAIGGVGAALLPAIVRAASRRAPPSRARAWFFAALAAPFVASLVPDAGRFSTRPVGALDTLEANPEGTQDAALLRALDAEAANEEGRLRVAYLRSGMSGAMFPLFAITDADAELVLDGHIAAVNFKHRISRRAAGYDALGVTHVIHDRSLEDDDDFASRLTQIGRFGTFRLARYTPAETFPPVQVRRGEGILVADAPEHVIVDVRAEGPATVVVRRAAHLRWQVAFDGEPLETEPFRGVRGLTLLSVQVPGTGRLEFTYRRTPAERAAGWISTIVWLLGMLALARARPLRLRDRARAHPALAPGLALFALAAVVFAGRLQAAKLQRTWQHFAADRAYRGAPTPEEEAALDERPHLIRDLVDEGAVEFRRTPGRACNGLLGKDVLEGCSEAEHAPLRATTYRAPYLYRCVEFGLPPGGTVEITLGDGEHDVLGRLTRRLLGSPGRGLKFGVGSPAKPRKLRSDDYDFVVPDPEGPVVATIRNDGRHMERFCLAAAEVEAPAQGGGQ